MAGSFSDFLELELLDHVFGAAAYTAPVTLYVALYTADPSDAGGGTEVAAVDYARKAVTNNDTNFPAAAAGAKSNGAAITWDAATSAWGTVIAVGIFDAATDGNLLAWSDLAIDKAISSGDTATIAIGDLDITLG